MITPRSDTHWKVLAVFIRVLNLVMSESCIIFRTQDYVTIDTSQCLFQNFTEPVSKWLCLDSCQNNRRCTGVALERDVQINWCCLVTEPEIKSRKRGNMILYYTKEMHVTYQTRRSSRNNVPCAPRWTGPNCDACEGFGFSRESRCTECIVNGQWAGTWGVYESIEVNLTFEGAACAELVPGTSTVNYNGLDTVNITGGYYDNATGTLMFTDNIGIDGYNPVGQVNLLNKSVNGTFTGYVGFGCSFNMSYFGQY